MFFKPKDKNKISLYLTQIMYGGLDGVVTTFAVVAGFNGATAHNNINLTTSIVLLFGFANLFADATSMGLGNFLSVRTKNAKGRHKEKPGLSSIATFLSFVTFGFVPLIPYIVLPIYTTNIFLISVVFSLASLIFLAMLRAHFTTEGYFKVMSEVLLIGGLAGAVAYFVGTFFG